MRQLSLSITKTPWEVAKYSTKLTNTTRIALLFIAFMSILSWFYYYSENLTLAYNDARSHLNISRRVVDSLQPGLAQLGTVWLPLQHVLQLPTIWVDYLYHSGISGSLISILAFILSSYILAKIARVLGFSDFQSVLLLVVFSLNPNLLYMQTSPMTESLLIFTLVFSTYYLLLWEKTGSIGHLIIAAFGVFLAVLARYDGWFFYLYALVAVFLVSLLKSGFRRASANVVLFGAIPGFAVFLWLLWNQLIFGNFLEFMNGSFSAKAQQDILLAEGRLLTKGSLAQSAYTYALTVIENSGLLVVILGVLGVFRTIYI